MCISVHVLPLHDTHEMHASRHSRQRINRRQSRSHSAKGVWRLISRAESNDGPKCDEHFGAGTMLHACVHVCMYVCMYVLHAHMTTHLYEGGAH